MTLLFQAILPAMFTGLPAPEVVDLFESQEHVVSVGVDAEKTYHYRLLRPRAVRRGIRQREPMYPLIVWLHGYGAGEFAAVGLGQLNHVGSALPNSEAAELAEFYLLALQCPADQRGFFGTDRPAAAGGAFPEPGEALVEVIGRLLATEPIDKNRVTLIGISGGATAAWELAGRYPELFAGVAPLGGGGASAAMVNRLNDVPVWAFHTRGDLNVSPDGVTAAVEQLQRNGGRAFLTFFPGTGHSCWEQAFKRCDLLDWLLSQERGARFARPPGFIPWTPLELAAQVGIPLIIAAAIVMELRRRRSAPAVAEDAPDGS